MIKSKNLHRNERSNKKVTEGLSKVRNGLFCSDMDVHAPDGHQRYDMEEEWSCVHVLSHASRQSCIEYGVFSPLCDCRHQHRDT